MDEYKDFNGHLPVFFSADTKVEILKTLAEIKQQLNDLQKSPELKLKQVKAVKDDDGHWYVIPAEMENEFFELLVSDMENEYEKFNQVFGAYATGGDLNLKQLYAVI